MIELAALMAWSALALIVMLSPGPETAKGGAYVRPAAVGGMNLAAGRR